MNYIIRMLSIVTLLLFCSFFCDAFSPRDAAATTTTKMTSRTAALNAMSRGQTVRPASRRRELLARNGPFFKLDRFQGGVEFGSSAKLITKLDNTANLDGIAEWLSDGKGLALSIWDEKLMKDLGNNIYRLNTMKLQFVTIQLAPSVDMIMKTDIDKKQNVPIFSLRSVGFDPNISILPGVGVSAESLGVYIEVEGELQPTKDGKGVEGKISFSTKGKLPPPMRLLPEPALKLASDKINETIVNFAIQSFQKGAVKKYKEFQLTQ